MQIAAGLEAKVELSFRTAVSEPQSDTRISESVTVAVENAPTQTIAVSARVLGVLAYDAQPKAEAQRGKGVRLVSVADLAASARRPLPPIGTL